MNNFRTNLTIISGSLSGNSSAIAEPMNYMQKNSEIIVAELCDCLMNDASTGNLNGVEKVVVMLIEYAGYELARHSRSDLSTSVFYAAREVQRAFDNDRKRHAIGLSGNVVVLSALDSS